MQKELKKGIVDQKKIEKIEFLTKQDDCSSRPIALKIDTIAYKAAKDLVC